MRDLESAIIVQDVDEDLGAADSEVIRLGTGKERSQYSSSANRRVKAIEEQDIINLSEKTPIIEDEDAKLKEEE